jgi:hypothetical protein
MRAIGFALVSLAFVAACADSARFRPAKNAADPPAVKEAFRIKAATADCVLVGYINAEGERALDDIAVTAASHGANTYVVLNENRDERVSTRDAVDRDLVTTRTNRKLLAEAYRCTISGDVPR